MDTQDHASKRVGVIVVHGVGEAELGYSVNTLVYALQDKSQGYTVVPHSEIIRIEEEELRERRAKEKAPEPEMFRVVRRRAKHALGFDIVLEELFWADLTTLAPGRVNVLKGLFQLIFESHHFVDAMLDKTRGFGTALLRWLLLAATWFMRGPIAALTISASLVCALLIYAPTAEMREWPSWFPQPTGALKFVVIQAVLVGLALYGIWRAFHLKRVAWYDLVFWLGVMGAAIGLALVLAPQQTAGLIASRYLPDRLAECADTFRDECYVNVPYMLIVMGWRIWGGVIAFCVLLGVGLVLHARLKGDRQIANPICAALGVIVLQFMLWTIIVVTVMFPMLNRGELITGLTFKDPALTQAAGAAQLAGEEKSTAVIIRDRIACDRDNLPNRLQPVCDLMEPRKLVFEWIPPFKFVYAATAIAFLIAILIMLLVLARRWQLSRRHTHHLRSSSNREAVLHMEPDQLPRLVFSRWLLAYLLVAVVVLIAMIFWTKDFLDHLGTWRGIMLTVAAVAALGFPLLAGHRIANAIHIARDLLDHHYNPNLESAYYLFRWHFRLKSDKPRRHRIQTRLLQMLKELVEVEKYDAIVFVAHSQGSIVVFDYLARDEPLAELRDAAIGLVTFGSPIGNIYEPYFHEYRAGTGKVERVEERVVGWTNLTRVDDYIGGRIAHSRSTLIDNQTLARGGHTDYWALQDVVNAVDRMILLALSRSSQATRTSPAPQPSAGTPAPA